MRRLLVGLIVGLVAGCSPRVDAEKQAKQLVSAQLMDPSSAQFRDLEINRLSTGGGPPAKSVCGEVNGKNVFGGFVGFVKFRADLESKTVEIAKVGDSLGMIKLMAKCHDDHFGPDAAGSKGGPG